ncbi:MAG: hypothetical protein COA93_09495 [Alphaproteobacteria bacterium]|nr:MAG: hypothetical protein COA93_09495 [Alphaproteobacteria bacterium]
MITKLKKINHALALCQTRAKEGHISTFRQLCEIAYLQATRGIGYWHYHSARMWDKDMTWKEKKAILGNDQFIKRIFELNQHKYQGVSQYKPFEKAFFRLFNIPSAKYLGVLQQEWGITDHGSPLQSVEDLKKLFGENVGTKLCFKLVVGHGGAGFKAFEILDKKGKYIAKLLSSGEEYTSAELVEMLHDENPAGWVIEEYLQQHAEMAHYNPSSLNTIRMFVYQNNQGEVVTLGSYLRMGSEGSLIDNLESGGYGVEIDHKTGLLIKDFIFFMSKEKPLLFSNKDNVVIKGDKIPFWTEAEDMGKRALQCYPNTRFLGLDIAITEDGPVMIEMNIQPSFMGLLWLRLKTRWLLFE